MASSKPWRGSRLTGSGAGAAAAGRAAGGAAGWLRAAARPRICWKTSVTRSVEPSPTCWAALRACSASRRAMTAAWPAELRPCLSSSRLFSAKFSSDCMATTRSSAAVRPARAGLGDLAGARELGAQELDAARGGLGHVADLAQLGAQRGGALLGGQAPSDGLAGLEHGRAETVDVRADGVEALAARRRARSCSAAAR